MPSPTGDPWCKRYGIFKMLAEWFKPLMLNRLYFGMKVFIAFFLLKIFAAPHVLLTFRKLSGGLNVPIKVVEKVYS